MVMCSNVIKTYYFVKYYNKKFKNILFCRCPLTLPCATSACPRLRFFQLTDIVCITNFILYRIV